MTYSSGGLIEAADFNGFVSTGSPNINNIWSTGSTDSGWGFHERAEKLNGRMAMLGFIALLATEYALGGESFTRGLLGIG